MVGINPVVDINNFDPTQFYKEVYTKKALPFDNTVLSYLTPEEQQELKITMDPIEWAKDRLGWEARIYQREFFYILPEKKQIVLRWGRRLGKCVPGYVKIFDPSTGRRVPVKELFEKGQATISTMLPNRKIGITTTDYILDNGIKEVFRVKLKSGRQIDATGNHPLFTKMGWMEIENLKPGDNVAIPSALPYFGNKTLDKEEIKSIAHNLGEEIPEIIFELRREDVALFLSTIYAERGWMARCFADDEIEIGYLSPSIEVVRGIQHLLLRFGIQSSFDEFKYKFKNKQEIFYRLVITSTEDALKFVEEIDVFNKKCIPSHTSTTSVTDQPEICWDEIESIESIGFHQTYDLAVPDTHNFIAEDIITHNTDSMVVAALWFADTQFNADPNKKQYRVLIVCPYESQVDVLFERMKSIVENSPKLADSVKFTHHNATFVNGSVIIGKTAGTKQNTGAASLRGQGADVVILDEVDYMSDKDIMNIMQLKKEAPDRIRFITASTPTGDRRLFYRWCTEAENIGWAHIHRSSLVSKENHMVNPDNKQGLTYLEELKQQLTEIEFMHEVMAEFGESQKGLFQKRFIDEAINKGRSIGWRYRRIGGVPPKKRGPRILGVDWDRAAASTNMLIIEFNREDSLFYILERTEIPGHEFTYTEAVQKIITLNDYYKLDWLYIDQGYGETQIELLKKYGMAHPESGLHKKVVPIQFSQKIETRDPFTRMKVKKDIKPFMVNNAVNIFEKQMIVLDPTDNKVVKQLEDYAIKSVSPTGRPIYTDTEEHIVDCISLALFGFEQKYGELFKIALGTRILGLNNPIDDESLHSMEVRDKPRVVSLLGAPTRYEYRYDGTGVNKPTLMRSLYSGTRSRRTF